MKRVLVTGAAGFVGFYYAQRLCKDGCEVMGIDNLNDYYDPALKDARLAVLKKIPNFTFQKLDLSDAEGMDRLFKEFQPEYVVNLAAQAGVRYSLDHPKAYAASNLDGFLNILEGCRHHDVKHLVFASSSSVYGANRKLPFSEHDHTDHPVSLYAATKKAGEMMAHSYAHLYGIPCTGLRFFTVYGPWGRPDMAYFKFVQKIMKGEPIDVYNFGDMKRDFTYIDDIIESAVRVLDHVPQSNPSWDAENPDAATSSAPHRIYNIGNNNPEQLTDMIEILEKELGVEAKKNMLPMQPGDVYATYADVNDLVRDIGFKPATSLQDGLSAFVRWYKDFYGVDGQGQSAVAAG